MKQRPGVRVVGFVGLIVIGMALATACSSAAPQGDDAALKQQLKAKEQEVAAVKKELVSLQEKLKPAAPREPKRLEAKQTMDMGETPTAMFFATPEAGEAGGRGDYRNERGNG